MVTSTAFEINPPEIEGSSSIGKNSDDEEVGSRSSASDEENQAQSRYPGRLYVMEELEQVLPMRNAIPGRGISKFYVGKFKSFTSLADASASSSIQEIVKPEEHVRSETQEPAHIQSCLGQCPVLLASQGQCHGWDFQETSRIEQEHVSPGCAMTHSESYSYSTASDDSSSSNFSHSPPPATSPSKPRIPRPSWFPSAEELSLLDVDHHGSTPRPTCGDGPLPSIALKTDPEEQT